MSLLTNLVGYYKLDENTGTTVNDSSPSANTGTFQGTTPYWTGGISNYGGLFNGTNDVAVLAAAPTTVIDNFSVSAWIKPVLPQNTGMIVYVGDDSGGWGLAAGNTSDTLGSGLVALFGLVAWIDPSVTLTNGIWQQVGFIRNSGTLTFYVNGVASGSTAANTPGTPTTGRGSIGSELNQLSVSAGAPFRFYQGSIDEVGIWNRALSAAEMLQLWNNGYGLPYPFTNISLSPSVPSASFRFIDGVQGY